MLYGKKQQAMNLTSISWVAAWTGLMTVTLGAQTALAELLAYVPLGGDIQIGGNGYQMTLSTGR